MSSSLTNEQAAAQLDAHTVEMVKWHFSPETGCPYWLDRAKSLAFDPLKDIRSFADIQKFDPFDDEILRKEDPARFIPKAFAGRPYNVFETGGTTGMPKQRIGWDDYKTDYTEFSDHYGPDFFPAGANWLMVGPTGPRRLRMAIEHLANIRGGACYFIDLDPRWVKRLIGMGEMKMARLYQEHVIDQAATIIRHRDIGCMFTTPKLLESLAERMSLADAGIGGVFAGGTTMTPQYVRRLRKHHADATGARGVKIPKRQPSRSRIVQCKQETHLWWQPYQICVSAAAAPPMARSPTSKVGGFASAASKPAPAAVTK